MAAAAHHTNYYTEIATNVAGGLLVGTGIYASLGGKIPYLFKPYNLNATTAFEGLKPTTDLNPLYKINIDETPRLQYGYYAIEVGDNMCFTDKLGDLEIIDIKQTPRSQDNYYADKLGDLEVALDLEIEEVKVETIPPTERRRGLLDDSSYDFHVSSKFRALVHSFPVKQLTFSVLIACAIIVVSIVSVSLVKKVLQHLRDSIMQDVQNELKKENRRVSRELAEATLFIVNHLENQEKVIAGLGKMETVITRLKDHSKDIKEHVDAVETLVNNVDDMQTLLRKIYKDHRMSHLDYSSKLQDLSVNIDTIDARLTTIERNHSATDGKVDLLQNQRLDFVAAMRKYSTLNLEANNAYAQKISSMDKDNVEGILSALLDVVSLEMRWNQDQVAMVKKRVEWLCQAASTPSHFRQK